VALKAGMHRAGRCSNQLVERLVFVIFLCTDLSRLMYYFSSFNWCSALRHLGPISFNLGFNMMFQCHLDTKRDKLKSWESDRSDGIKTLAPRASKEIENSVLPKVDQFDILEWIVWTPTVLCGVVSRIGNLDKGDARLVEIVRHENGPTIIKCTHVNDPTHSCLTREEASLF
jgi:hypothetical protein